LRTGRPTRIRLAASARSGTRPCYAGRALGPRGPGLSCHAGRGLLPRRPGRARPPACSVRGVHFVIMGAGGVGTTLATTLTARGHSVAIIDQNPDSFRRLPEEFEGRRVTGMGFDRDALTQAGIEE